MLIDQNHILLKYTDNFSVWRDRNIWVSTILPFIEHNARKVTIIILLSHLTIKQSCNKDRHPKVFTEVKCFCF